MDTEKSLTFAWYAIVSGEVELEQGDLLDSFPILIPEMSSELLSSEPGGEGRDIQATVLLFDVVVMTQSCDLVGMSGEQEVILCPRYDYEVAVEANSKYGGPDGWGNLIRGRFLGAYIINKCDLEDHEFDYQVVDISRVFSVPFSIVQEVAMNRTERVRILPPYREHLAQAFARQFMRVGLPLDLPRKSPFV